MSNDMPPSEESDPDFIDLSRTFHELSKHVGESDDIDISQVFQVRSGLSWDEVLKLPRSIILSEAGSGKTQEIKNAAERLRAEGHKAFFLRLELITNDFDISFEEGTLGEFNEWLSSDEHGYIFLDSVDEAKLVSPLDFDKAVRRFGQRIDKAKLRSHIILTGRTHAWRPKSDFVLCNTHLGFVPPTKAVVSAVPPQDDIDDPLGILDDEDTEVETSEKSDGDGSFRILSLDDLSKEQVQTFASKRQVNNTEAFLDAIEKADAWSFTGRPQDLQEIVGFWLDEGRIGSRLEVMQNSVRRRLTEWDPKRGEVRPLSEEKAYQGAILTAATATMTQTQTIMVPDSGNTANGISMKSALPTWPDNEINALLSRPIFDNAIYGTVRFHHRSVREYLTAVWLKGLLEKPASRKKIEALLFTELYGLEVVIPTMRPVLPWLSIFDSKIRDRVRRIAPEVIFEGGDPSSLPLPVRKDLLAKVCERIAADMTIPSATEYSAIQRFANEDIAEDIRALLKQHASSADVVAFLTRMVWLGRLPSLLAEVKMIALSEKTALYTRISALRAVRVLGTSQDHTDVRNATSSEPRISREWLAELLVELKPTDATISWLLSALAKSHGKQRYTADRLGDAVTAFVENAPIDLVPDIIAGLRQLFRIEPFIERRYCEVSKRYSWLMKAAVVGAERLIEAKHPHSFHEDVLAILFSCKGLRNCHDDVSDAEVDFAAIVTPWRELNLATFWHDVNLARRYMAKKEGRLRNYWQAETFGSFWKFDERDFDLVCSWISSKSEGDDKLVALSLAFTIYVGNRRPKAWRAKMQSIVEGNAELEGRLFELLNPPPSDQTYKRQERRWKRQATVRNKKEADDLEKAKKYLTEHLDMIRSPNFPNPSDISKSQWYLHQSIREKKENSSRWTNGEWEVLTPVFGEEVAKAYRDGALNYWRKYSPKLRSEGDPANQTSGKMIFGLVGLAIESKSLPDWLEKLTKTDVEIATRYALHELNGFPLWFPGLLARHTNDVLPIILKEIEYELSQGSPSQDTHYVLSDISWSGEWAWKQIAPEIFQILEKSDPNNRSQLHHLLKLLLNSELDDTAIAKLAASKIASGLEFSGEWFSVWVGVDPAAAIPALRHHLSGLSDATARTDFSMHFVTKLWGGRRSEAFGTRLNFLRPPYLKELYTLMHEHIRISEDIDRANGGAYSPELRDDAQDARNRILQELNKIPGKEAFIALDELKALEMRNSTRAYLDNLSKQKAEQDSDLKPWSPTNVKEFNERLDKIPTNHRELADLAVLRLLDFKDDLEESDSSVYKILRTINSETIIRNYIADVLNKQAFDRYHVSQEEEMADAKKPDLRFHGMGFNAPVPIELKLADNNWSGQALFERLENQLAGDYLRDERSGRGVFALVYRGEKTLWQIPGTNRYVDFGDLIEALKAHWLSISTKYPGVEEITIIGVDLTKREK